MSSILSTVAAPNRSPLSLLQNELASEVKSGKISADDQSALSAALTDVDSQLRALAPTGGSRPSPGDMKAKIHDLIDGEVSSGKLTSAQAEELKDVFSNAFKNGPGGPGRAPGVDGPDGANQDADVATMISDFLKLLQDSKASSSAYGSNGDNLIAQVQSLIMNYQA